MIEVNEQKYWIDRHKYYELKHLCLQYPIFKEKYEECFKEEPATKEQLLDHIKLIKYYFSFIDIIKSAAYKTSNELFSYILLGVTEGLSYEGLVSKFQMKCDKDTYYDLYRRFFWILDKERMQII